MARGFYSERWQVIDVGGNPVLVHVTGDMSEPELVDFFKIALSAENWEYCEALEAEANKRHFTLKKRQL